jgi:6-oxo-cyclohex-1-ene-carbonyl-CoA hydrolase
MATFVDHNLTSPHAVPGVRYEETRLRDPAGAEVPGLHVVRLTLDNPSQLNSYTTEMVKGVILGMRTASNDRAAVAVVITGSGTRAFCTGGNTAQYAEYYAGRPEEYRQYMRLFNDMVSAILLCDKPVICRVNGMRIAGGQEIGMACDFSVAQDLAVFGQAGPRHGSAPDGGSTDFLPLFVGIEAAMELHALRALERPQGLPAWPADHRRARAHGGRPLRLEPVRDHRSLDRRRPHRLRRAEDRCRAR